MTKDDIASLGGIGSLSQLLLFNSSIIHLNLCGCDIGSNIRLIAQALKNNSKLQRTDLYCTGIGVEGARVIAEMLRINYVLNEIYLGENGIWAQGAREIAKALGINCALHTIHLYGNGIGDMRELKRLLKC